MAKSKSKSKKSKSRKSKSRKSNSPLTKTKSSSKSIQKSTTLKQAEILNLSRTSDLTPVIPQKSKEGSKCTQIRGVKIGPGVKVINIPSLGTTLQVPGRFSDLGSKKHCRMSCPVLERTLCLDSEQESRDMCTTSDNSMNGIPFLKSPKLTLDEDGDPFLRDDSEEEVDDEKKIPSLAIVHVTPPSLVQRNETLFHVNVVGEGGVLEVDRLDDVHPLPNCILRKMEIEKGKYELFPDGYIKENCCNDLFLLESSESDSEEAPDRRTCSSNMPQKCNEE